MRFFAAEGNNGVSLCGQANTACIFAGIREKQVKIRSGMPLRILMVEVFGVILKRSIKDTFILSYFSVKKSTKSHLRGLSTLLKIFSPVSATPTNALRALVHSPRARVSRASYAWKVRAAHGRVKVGSIAPSAISYYHACEHITRDSRADSCTHCLHAR